MGLLMGALGGAAAAVGKTAEFAMRNQMEEAKAQRIAEYTSKLRLDEDAETRKRTQADAATERGRVQTEAQGIAAKRGGGLLSQSATDAYNAYAQTDPTGAAAGLKAVEDAKASGAYGQPTADDFLMAQGNYGAVATGARADRAAATSQENWQKTFEENKRQHREMAGRAAEALNLTKQEKAERKAALDAYSVAKTNEDLLPATADEATRKMARIATSNAGLVLSQYGIKLGGGEDNVTTETTTNSQTGATETKVTVKGRSAAAEQPAQIEIKDDNGKVVGTIAANATKEERLRKIADIQASQKKASDELKANQPPKPEPQLPKAPAATSDRRVAKEYEIVRVVPTRGGGTPLYRVAKTGRPDAMAWQKDVRADKLAEYGLSVTDVPKAR